MMTNSDPTNCPIVSCTITGSNSCSGQTWYSFDSNSPWSITYDTSASGCRNNGNYACTTSYGASSELSVSYRFRNFCVFEADSSALADVSEAEDPSDSSALEIAGGGWDDFFDMNGD
jgi:hypothetical protein